MARQLLNLPINVAWVPIATSPDMMDTKFCNKSFPFEWSSSLAISAFEPKAEDLPEEFCHQRVSYFKITCTVTGYQPTKEETDQIIEWPGLSTEDRDRLIEENSYFACYGVLLNLAVFPSSKTKTMLNKNTVDFVDQEVDSALANPLQIGDVAFESEDTQSNFVIDIFPEGGDSKGELAIQRTMTISLPSSSRIEAKVVHSSEGVSAPVLLTAFRDNEVVGTQEAGPEPFFIHELFIDGENINRIVLTSEVEQASLLELTYYVPKSVEVTLNDYPRIIDFQPKVRDLYQSASETGEVLSASISKVSTDKTLAHTETTETGMSLSAKYKPTENSEIAGSLSHKWGETDQDQFSIRTDASRERREKEGMTTQLSQMYNLLTGYHQGTNRAVFLMLPRPHVLESTDRRTFIQGLRAIEGVQEFMLVVTRPEEIEGICIEALLETGHFPEDIDIEQPPDEFEESHEDFTVTGFADNSTIFQNCENFMDEFTVQAGWVIDRRLERKRNPGDPVGSGWDENHPGVAEIANNSNGQANDTLDDYDYRAISDIAVRVKGRICGARAQGDKARFKRVYRVFTRSEEPKSSSSAPDIPIETLIITSRGLCACIKSGEVCPELVPFHTLPDFDFPETDQVVAFRESIVDERPIKINPVLIRPNVSQASRMPPTKDLLRRIQSAMTMSWRLPSRYPAGEIGFTDSDFFKNQVLQALPNDQLNAPITSVEGLPDNVLSSLSDLGSIAEALELGLSEFSRKTGLTLEEAADVRRRLLGIGSRPPNAY